MTTPTKTRQMLRHNLQNDFQLSGDDLVYASEFAEKNLTTFAESIQSLLRDKNWEELQYGADGCRALGETIGWGELSEVGFALGQGVKQEDSPAVASARQRLCDLLAQLQRGDTDRQPGEHRPPEPPIRFKLD